MRRSIKLIKWNWNWKLIIKKASATASSAQRLPLTRLFVLLVLGPDQLLCLFYFTSKFKKYHSFVFYIIIIIIIISPHLGFLYISKQKNCIEFFFFLFYFFGMRGLMGKDFLWSTRFGGTVVLRPDPEGVALFIYLFFKKVALKHFLPHKMWSLLAHFEADNMPHLPPTSTGSHKS